MADREDDDLLIEALRLIPEMRREVAVLRQEVADLRTIMRGALPAEYANTIPHPTLRLSALTDALRTACEELKVSPTAVMGTRKTRKAVRARWMIWASLRANGWTQQQIADRWGLDHSTVGHGLKRHEEILKGIVNG